MKKLSAKLILPILMLVSALWQPVLASGPLTATLSITNVQCNGYDGSILIHASGGTAPYLYSLTDPYGRFTGFQSVDSFTYVNPGTSLVTVSDAAGTSYSITANLTQPTPLVVLDSVVNATGGLNNGALYTFVSGGVPPYTYRWENGDTTPNHRGLAPGVGAYSIYVNDANGCQGGINQITIDTGSSALKLKLLNIHVSGCYPTQTFQIEQAITGGVGPYNYTLDGGRSQATSSGDFSIYNMFGKIHTFHIADSRNHTLTVIDTFATVASARLTEAIQITQASGGLNNGSVIATATGGTPPYTFTISNFNVFTGLAPNQYGVQVTDTNGCGASLLAIIVDTTINPPLTCTFTITSIDCGNSGRGQAYITPSGGVPPYLESIDSNRGNYGVPYFYGITAGNHTIHVRDARGTIFNLPVVMPGDNLQVNASVTNASNNLNNGAIALSINLGATPYTINWSDGTHVLNKSGLAYGTSLNVTVTDSLGCNANGNYLIDSGRLAASYVVKQPSACDGGHVIITPSGGTWPYRDDHGNQYNPSYDFNNLYAGTYTFLVIDAVNDTVRVTATVTGTAPARLAITYTTTAAGNGNSNGTITANITGGTPPYHYRWNFTGTQSLHLTGVAAGNYYLRVTDTAGCRTTQYNITVYDTTGIALGANVHSYPNSQCDTTQGQAEVDVYGGTGPYQVSIGSGFGGTDNNDRINYYSLHPGVYPLTVIDAAGDTFRASVTVVGLPVSTNPVVVTVTITNPTPNLDNGSIQLHISGGVPPYSFGWYPLPFSTSTLTGLAPGTYTVNVGDSLGCGTQVGFTLDTVSSVLAATASVYNTPCLGQASIGVTATGGTQPYLYQIDGGPYLTENIFGGQFSTLLAGPHIIKVKDGAGTIVTLHDTVAVQPNHFYTTGTVTNATAVNSNNGAIALHFSGAVGSINVYWIGVNNNTANVAGLAPGTYTAYTSDSFGCGTPATFVVGAGSAALSATAHVTNVACHGDSTGAVTLLGNSANQPLLYRIGTGPLQTSNVFSHLAPGTYTFTVVDATSATTTVTATVHQPAAPLTVTATQYNANGGAPTGQLVIAISGGTAPYTAGWADALGHNTTRTPLYFGTYDLGVTDSLGCIAELVYTVDSTVLARISAHTDVLCFGDSSGTIHVSASGGSPAYLYRLGSGAYQTDSIFRHLTPGTYTITVRAIGNDSSAVTQTIVSNHTAIVTNGIVTNTSGGQNNGSITLNVSGGVQPYMFNWGAGITTENRSNLATGSYTITVTDSAGCHASKTFTIVATGIFGPYADALGLNMYPNPSSGLIHLHLDNTYGDVTIAISDLTGQIVMTKNLNATGATDTTLDLQALATGIYQIQVRSGEQSSTARIVISK